MKMNKIIKYIKIIYWKFWIYVIKRSPTMSLKEEIRKIKEIHEYQDRLNELNKF
jgi:hypothetical protein